MTSFVQPDFPMAHASAARITGVLVRARHALARLGSPAAMAHMQARRQAAAQRAGDRDTWDVALTDPRLMAELDCAMLHAQQEAEANGQAMPQ